MNGAAIAGGCLVDQLPFWLLVDRCFRDEDVRTDRQLEVIGVLVPWCCGFLARQLPSDSAALLHSSTFELGAAWHGDVVRWQPVTEVAYWQG